METADATVDESSDMPDMSAEDDCLIQPTGQGDHVVREGECVSSIAKESGHFWETIWNDPANADLKAARENPNVLLPEDRVTVPALRPKTETGATEQRHRFKRKGEPSALNLQIKDDDEPRANQPYELDVDGSVRQGTTDAEGKINTTIPGNARKAVLTVGPEDDPLTYELNLGAVYPIDSVAGVQQRLKNQEYYAGAIDGEVGPLTRQALGEFQEEYGLDNTCKPDKPTREKLLEVHGC